MGWEIRYFMNKNFNPFNYLSMFCICFIDVRKLPEHNLRKKETRSFNGLYVKTCIILTHSAFDGIT
jgi:hypothetical protein